MPSGDMNTNPKVSIIIPVYNGANYLAQAIECALAQTYDNTEVLVVNDGSNDGGATEKTARSYGDKIRYFYKDNGGVSSALNLGIKNMQGEYFSWLSHDDLYENTKIADGVKLLEQSGDASENCIAYTGCTIIDSEGNGLKKYAMPFEPGRIYSGLQALEIMTKSGTLHGCSMLIPRRAFERVAFFDESLRYSQDSLMWYLLFLNGYSLVSDNKQNVKYRLHPGQTSQIRRDLFEKDALSIAKMLAPSLSRIDDGGQAYFNYTKRLTKQKCRPAIAYLKRFAAENNVLNAEQRRKLRFAEFFGAIRFGLVKLVKKLLLNKKAFFGK